MVFGDDDFGQVRVEPFCFVSGAVAQYDVWAIEGCQTVPLCTFIDVGFLGDAGLATSVRRGLEDGGGMETSS